MTTRLMAWLSTLASSEVTRTPGGEETTLSQALSPITNKPLTVQKNSVETYDTVETQSDIPSVPIPPATSEDVGSLFGVEGMRREDSDRVMAQISRTAGMPATALRDAGSSISALWGVRVLPIDHLGIGEEETLSENLMRNPLSPSPSGVRARGDYLYHAEAVSVSEDAPPTHRARGITFEEMDRRMDLTPSIPTFMNDKPSVPIDGIRIQENYDRGARDITFEVTIPIRLPIEDLETTGLDRETTQEILTDLCTMLRDSFIDGVREGTFSFDPDMIEMAEKRRAESRRKSQDTKSMPPKKSRKVEL